MDSGIAIESAAEIVSLRRGAALGGRGDPRTISGKPDPRRVSTLIGSRRERCLALGRRGFGTNDAVHQLAREPEATPCCQWIAINWIRVGLRPVMMS